MTLNELAARGYLEKRKPSKDEISDLLNVVKRDLDDARVPGLSADRSFATAYEAALALALIAVRAAGYRPLGLAHHYATIAALPDILGASGRTRADYFETCRRMRNRATYDRAGQVTAAQAVELIANASTFHAQVLDWLGKNHPSLVAKERLRRR